MEMTGEQLIPASQQETWDALNDPEFLKSCVPGCESMEQAGPNEYTVLMVARIGPVSAKFKGKMTISDVQPPNSYALAFEGQGGVHGFAKGTARVELRQQSKAETVLAYQAKANVGGKLAASHGPLIAVAARPSAKSRRTRSADASSGTAPRETRPDMRPSARAAASPRNPQWP